MRNGSVRAKTGSESVSGRTLGDFAVGDLIGSGGFGAVYSAEQISLKRPAVVKVLHASHRSNSVIIERFLREAQLASSLEHPYAAHLYAFGAENDGLLWIAMERVRGMGLDALLRTRGPLPLTIFIPLFERICEVVYTANEQGIVHRDLKPANVMVMTRAGQVLPKLLDFGIAKAIDVAEESDVADEGAMGRAETAPIIDGPTEQRGVVGSPHYMAPEQWMASAAVSARTDIYALGVLSFEALTGRVPFDAESFAELRAAHEDSPLPPLGGELPPELDRVLARAMAKSPTERFASALDFAAAMRAAAGLDGESPLPQLEPAVRDGFLADAPEPIAEAIAVLDAARNPHQARDAVLVVVDAIYRYLGLLSVAARSRIGPGPGEKTVAIDTAIVDLRRGGLDANGWRKLTSAITAPFSSQPDAFPIPELIAAVASPPFSQMASLRSAAALGTATEQVREWLDGALQDLGELIRAVDFVRDYPLIVPRKGYCQWWMGARRSFRGVVPAIEGDEREGEPLLVDLGQRPVLALWPLMMVGEPAPGVDEELFLLDGRSREGFARLVAVPSGFELHAAEPWEWLRRELMAGREISGIATSDRPPYPGLAAFTRDDATNFVGREREAEELINRLRIDPLIAVVGPSGAGKSSFVQAGVLPLLGSEWKVITARPGSSPLAALAAHLDRAGLLPEGVTAVAAANQLRQDPGLLGNWLHGAAPVIVVIDQLEELFTLCLDEGERAAYAEVLSRTASDPDELIRVIATLRDDFLLRAEALPGLRRRLARGLQLLTTPAPEELRRILVEPAQRAGYDFDDESLPDEMIDEVAGAPGALALLAFTAARLWELRDRHFYQLTRKTYEGMGGVGGALAQHAEHSLEQLPGQDRELVREAFRHLVTAEGTRAVLVRDDLEQLLGGSDRASAVVEQLIKSRLLVASEDAAGENRIEVIHEALIEAWPRLARWRHEDAEGARLRDQIRAAARQWHDRNRPGGLLWRGDALLELELWRKRFGEQLTRAEVEFAEASSAEATRGRRIRGGLLVLAMIALAAAALVLLRFYRTADAQRDRAEDQLTRLYQEQGRQAVLARQPMRALAYLDEAYRRGARGNGIELMIAQSLESLGGQLGRLSHGDRVMSVAFDATGERLLTASGDKTARIWNAETGELISELAGGHTDMVNSVELSSDGQLAVTGSSDFTAVVWDVATRTVRHRLEGHRRGVAAAKLIDDQRVLTVGRDGLAAIFSAETGEKLVELRGHSDWLWDAVVSPDGEHIATASHDKTARIWNSATGETVAVLEHAEPVHCLQYDATGERLVTSSWDGKLNIWTSTGELIRSIDAHGEPVWSVSISADGALIATASQDETAKLWNAETGARVAVLSGHDAPLLVAAFSPDSQRLATAGHDEMIRLWSRSGQLLAEHAGHTDTVWRLAFSPDGQRLASASFDHSARIWDATRTRLLAETRYPTGNPSEVVVSDDGRRVLVPLLMSGGDEAHLLSWTQKGEATLVAKEPALIFSAAFEPGSARIVIGRGDGLVEAIDTTGARQQVARLEGEVHSVSFAGDQLVAAGKRQALISRRDGERWHPVNELALFEDTTKLVTSADGRQIAAGSATGQIGVWLVDGRARWRRSAHTLEIKQLAFTGDGRLISASADKTVHVADLETGETIGRIEAEAELSDLALISDDLFVTSSSTDGTLRLWSVGSGAQLGTLVAAPGVVKIASAGSRRLAVAESEQLRLLQLPGREIDGEKLGQLTRCLSPFHVAEERLVRNAERDVQGCANLFSGR